MELGIGVIGLGVHARRAHIDHLPGLPARLVAVCDTDAAKMADFPDARACADETALLADPGVHAVMVMTPDRFHVASALAALEAGKHVFVEKPVIDRFEDVALLREAVATAARLGLVLTTCHPRRFDRPFLWLKGSLDRFRAAFGPVLEFRFDFSYAEPRPETAGHHRSLLLDHFGHEVDLMHFLFGRRPFAAQTLFDAADRYHVAGARDDGMAFAFSGTRMLRVPAYPESCAVRFARGEVAMDMQGGLARVFDREAGTAVEEACGTTDYDGRFSAVNRDFVLAALGIGPGYLEPEDLLVNNLSAVSLADARAYVWNPGAGA